MADGGESITITAALIDEVSPNAKKAAASVKELGEAAKSAGTGSTSVEQLGTSLDNVTTKAGKTAPSTEKLSSSLKNLEEQTKKVREGFIGMGDAAIEKVTYPMQQLTWAAEGAIAGLALLGVTTYASLQSSNTQLIAFAGNAEKGTAAFKALYALSGPASMSTLQSSYETLSLAGYSNSTSMSLMRALTGAGAIAGNSDSAIPAAASALASIRNNYGRIGGSQLQALQQLFPQAASLLAGDVGMSPQALRQAMLASDYQPNMPANFLSQLEGTSQARTGRSTYMGTFSGQLDQLHKNVDKMLSELEMPLIATLGRSMTSIDTWAKGVETRFGQLSGTLAKEWDSGNTAGFSNTLATLLGDPKAGAGIKSTIRLLDDLGRVFKDSVVPGVEAAAHFAEPFFNFVADHRTTTELLVDSLGGFLVFSKVIGPLQTTVKLMQALTLASGEQGAAGALKVLTKSFLGLDTAEAGGTAAAGAGGGTGVGTSEGGAAASESAGLGPLGMALLAGGFGLRNAVKNHQQGGWMASGIPYMQYLPPSLVQPLLNGQFGKLWSNLNTDIDNPVNSAWHDVSGWLGIGGHKSAAGAINVNQMNITVPGSGDPEKVANAIPKGINAQVKNYNQQQSRRTGGSG